MSGMIRAAIRWCLVGLLLAGYVPIPAASGPAAAPEKPLRAACCAPKACCTVDHACAGGGACATKGHALAASRGDTDTFAPVLRATACHPEAARVASAPSHDPIVFTSLPVQPGGAFFTRSGASEGFGPPYRFSAPQVPPPRA